MGCCTAPPGCDTNWHRLVTRTGTNRTGVWAAVYLSVLASIFVVLAVVMGVLMGVWTPCESGDLAPGATMTCFPRGDTVAVRTDSTDCVSYSERSSWSPHIEHRGSCDIYLGFDDRVTTKNRGSTTAHVVQKNKVVDLSVFPPFIIFTVFGSVLTVAALGLCCVPTADSLPPTTDPKAVYVPKEQQTVDGPAPSDPTPTGADQPPPAYTGYTPGVVSGTQAITVY